jgi:Tfp pilus assembly protein PilE
MAARFCADCGAAMPQTAPAAPAMPAAKVADQNAGERGDDPLEYYKAVIGHSGQAHYLPVFMRFWKNGGSGISWHWPAFFVTFYWFLYRKMWAYAAIYFFLPYIVMIPMGIIAVLLGKYAFVAVILGWAVIFAVQWILAPMYANALYYRHCKQKIEDAKLTSRNPQTQLGQLAASGGTSVAALVIVMSLALLWVIMVLGILAAIAIPAYQEYTVRARVSEAVTVGKSATASVAEYYRQHQQLPDNLAQAGFSAPLPSSVRDITLNTQNGVVTMTMALKAIEGQKLELVPRMDQDNQITWQCTSEEIRRNFLPSQCRPHDSDSDADAAPDS